MGQVLTDFWLLPRVARLSDIWVGDVRDGRNVLLFAPRCHGTAAVGAEVRRLLTAADFYTLSVDASITQGGAEPFDLLRREIGDEEDSSSDLGSLDWLEACRDVPDVIVVSGLEQGEEGGLQPGSRY